MTIIEIAPHYAQEPSAGTLFRSAVWNSSAATQQIALDRGHSYRRLTGDVSETELRAALGGASALVWAPVTNPQPADESLARNIIAGILPVLEDTSPDLHLILVSHFLVGHGPTHRNAKVGTWTLQATEQAVRRSDRDWTIVRPTWLAQRGIDSYRPAITQDTLADGLVTVHSVGNAVVSAVEQREAARGITLAVYDAADGREDLSLAPIEFGATLVRDYEYTAAAR